MIDYVMAITGILIGSVYLIWNIYLLIKTIKRK